MLHRDEEALRELLPAQGRLKGLLGQEVSGIGQTVRRQTQIKHNLRTCGVNQLVNIGEL